MSLKYRFDPLKFSDGRVGAIIIKNDGPPEYDLTPALDGIRRVDAAVSVSAYGRRLIEERRAALRAANHQCVDCGSYSGHYSNCAAGGMC